MKLKEIRGKDARELKLDAQAIRQDMFKLRFRTASEEIADPSRIKSLRRTIAQINTVIREREIAETKAAKGSEE